MIVRCKISIKQVKQVNMSTPKGMKKSVNVVGLAFSQKGQAPLITFPDNSFRATDRLSKFGRKFSRKRNPEVRIFCFVG